MKILVIHNTYQQPGGEDVVCNQEARLLEEHGHEVVRYIRSNHEIEQLTSVGRLTLPVRMTWATDTCDDVRQLIRLHKPDLVHVYNTLLMVSPSVFSACREENVPVVHMVQNYRLLCPAALFFRNGQTCEECTDHGMWRGVWHGCYRESHLATGAVALMLKTHRARGTWHNSVDAYVVTTEFARQKFAQGALPADKIFVKPNFVNPDPGKRTGRGDYALFAGRLSVEKGLSTLLEAWRQLPSNIPLVIVGDGPLRPQLEAEVQRNRLNHVKFAGRLDGAETRAAMKKASFLVLPSLWYEGFPMVMAESLACGVPVIASQLGAMEEVIRHGRNGLHFATGDAADLAKKASWAWQHPSELEGMGHQARADYQQLYTPSVNYARLMEIYDYSLAPYERRSRTATSVA